MTPSQAECAGLRLFFPLPKDTDNILHAARILLVLVAGYFPPPLQMGGLSLGKQAVCFSSVSLL